LAGRAELVPLAGLPDVQKKMPLSVGPIVQTPHLPHVPHKHVDLGFDVMESKINHETRGHIS